MKTSVNGFFILIAFLLGSLGTVAKNTPPVPNPNGRNQGGLPLPPGVPIDENLPFLLIIAILFGIYIVYNQFLKQRTQY